MGALGQSFRDTRCRTGSAGSSRCIGCRPDAARPPLAAHSAASAVEEHAGAEQLNPLAPPPSPGRDRAIFHGDRVAVGGHDPRRDLAGAGVFGLTGAPRVSAVISAGAPIAARERVVAVGAQRHPIGTGLPGPARVGDLSGRQPFGGAARRARRAGAPRDRTGRGWCCVATDPTLSAAPALDRRPHPRRRLLFGAAADLVGDQLLGMPDRRTMRPPGWTRWHPHLPAGRWGSRRGEPGWPRTDTRSDVGADGRSSASRRALCGPAPAPGRSCATPAGRPGNDTGAPTGPRLEEAHRQHQIPGRQAREHHRQRTVVIGPRPASGPHRGRAVGPAGPGSRCPPAGRPPRRRCVTAAGSCRCR